MTETQPSGIPSADAAPSCAASPPLKGGARGARLWRLALALAIGLGIGALADPFLSPPDCAAYFSWTWSLVSDGDFSFTNEFALFRFPIYSVRLTPAGRVANDWPMGAGLAWAPAVALARLAQCMAPGGGEPCPGARFQRLCPPGPLPVSFALLWTSCLTLWVFARAVGRAREKFGPAAARFAAFAAALGSPFFFYLLFGPFFSHGVSFAAVGAFLLFWERRRGENWTWSAAGVLGLLAGWMILVRPQSALYLLVIPVDWLARRARERNASRGSYMTYIHLWIIVVIFTLAAALAFAPQMIAWARLYGSPLALPKVEEMRWLAPNLAGLLFSDYHGVIPWTPVLALIAPGFFFLWRRDPPLALALAAALAAQVYLNAANAFWWGSGSFGSRRLLDAGVIGVFALAALWHGVSAFRPDSPRAARALRWTLAGAAVCGCLWTLLLALAERLGALTLDHYVPFDRALIWRVVSGPLRVGEVSGWIRSGGGALPWGYRLFLAAGIAGFLFWKLECNSRRSGPGRPWRFSFDRPGGVALAGAAALILALASAWAAWRTPAFDPAWIAEFEPPRENRSLWGNHLEAGHFWLERGQPGRALESFQNAEALRPNDLTARRWQGVALRELERWEDAARLFSELLDAAPGDAAIRREALALARRWSDTLPADPRPWEWLARWFDRLGMPEEAQEARREAQRRLLNAAPAAPTYPAARGE